MKRQKKIFLFIVLGCAAFLFLSSDALANVIIKVRALNPLKSDETASISYPLPPEVTPSDIIDKKITFSLEPEEGEEVKTTFNIEYMPEEGRYYIVDEVPLGPREVATLEVHVRDIWFIAPDMLETRRKKVEDLIANYQPIEDEGEEGGGAEQGTIDTLKEQISMELEEIAGRQTNSTVLKVGVEEHMKAYYKNLEVLSQLDADIGMLQYLLEPEEDEGEENEGEDGQLQEEAEGLQQPQEEIPVSDVP